MKVSVRPRLSLQRLSHIPMGMRWFNIFKRRFAKWTVGQKWNFYQVDIDTLVDQGIDAISAFHRNWSTG